MKNITLHNFFKPLILAYFERKKTISDDMAFASFDIQSLKNGISGGLAEGFMSFQVAVYFYL